MQYQYTSLRNVIGNVIRNTRIQDSSFIADIHEWLYEAMDMLETEYTLECVAEKVTVAFHKAKLPCGLRWIDAVEYNGHRLREGGGVRPAENDNPVRFSASGAAFATELEKQDSAGHLLYTTKLTDVQKLAPLINEYYYTSMGTINTSFCDGEITLYYAKVKTDEDGFPMIPDSQNYMQALYWYCRGMMIGAGWQDPIFRYQDCLEQFEKIYGPRALAEIRLPSPEQMEKRINTFVRFLPHEGFYDNFFSTPTKEGMYDQRGYAPGYGSSTVNPQQPYIVGTKPTS